MAQRPVFVPLLSNGALVDEVPVQFPWHSGMAASQKKKNVVALHDMAAAKGLAPLLEISSKSEREVGRKLSAFHLKVEIEGQETTLECAFQGSKVFEQGGPYTDLYWADSRDAKRDPRLRESGNLIRFEFEGQHFPLVPSTAFYDWLYIRALYPHRDWLRRLSKCAGFTDIEFNPSRSINCQARSCATFLALQHRGNLAEATESFPYFSTLLSTSQI
ncbi:DarT1-associated NADAR antitoxin family protein [Sphingomonas sp. Tas61C01]|uniref:DarT1-associated NADAR antitoxin family protein n=1 Tax=Sphingomonas sp. Tas61C01 TaxID=3458297 RepID=UPI00403E3789